MIFILNQYEIYLRQVKKRNCCAAWSFSGRQVVDETVEQKNHHGKKLEKYGENRSFHRMTWCARGESNPHARNEH